MFIAPYNAHTEASYRSYPDNVIYEFSKRAVENGLDICKLPSFLPQAIQ